MSIRQILTYAAIAFVIWWVVEQPSNAAHLIHNIGTLLSSLASGLSRFVSSV